MADHLSAVGSLEGPPRGRRVRKSPAARRAELLVVARQVINEGGLADGGMAEVATMAGVSPGLLYHYFPAGRPELLDAVALDLLDELIARMRVAESLPFSPIGRLEQVLAVMVGFFTEHPAAHRLLLADDEDAAAGSSANDAVHHLAFVRLVSAMTALMAGSGRSPDELMTAGTELLEHLRGDVGASLGGAQEPEAAWRSCCERAAVLFADGTSV
jgi:AcrR family transcriptional regulator